MATAEVKHFTLAKELQYDVSYISKWIGGRVLPSEKSACDVLTKISHCLVDNASPKGLQQLLQDYELTDVGELCQAIYDNLIAEYYYVQELQQSSGSSVAPQVTFFPELTMKKFVGKMNHPVLRRVKSQDIVAAIDLFGMDNEFRFQMVNLEPDKSVGDHSYPNVRYSLIISLSGAKRHPIHGALFVARMLTNSSQVDFHLYGSEFAQGKVVFVVKHDFAITGMLLRSNACAAVTVCEGTENATPLYNNLQSLCTRENLLFRRLSIHEMLVQTMDYVHLLLSPERRWLMGHVTEHLLPDDLFQELVEEAQASGRKFDPISLTNAHNLTRSILENGGVRLLICETALSRFVVGGIVDVFNYKLTLDFRQRSRVIEYLQKLLSEKLEVRFIHEPLIPDDQNDGYPSVFLGDSIGYLRLDNRRGGENLLMKISSPEMKELYGHCFEKIWNKEDIAVSRRGEMERFLCRLTENLRLLNSANSL